MEELTEEQIQELKDKVVTLEKEKEDSTAKMAEYESAKTEWEKKEKEFQDQANPNWQKARKVIQALKDIAKEKGVEVDDEGNVISNPQKVDMEQIKQEAINAAKTELVGSKLEELLGEYEEEDAKLVRHFYSKLTAGEAVNLQNVQKFVKQAEGAAERETGNRVSKTSKATTYSGGQGPRYSEGEIVDDARVEDLASKLGVKINSEEQK